MLQMLFHPRRARVIRAASAISCLTGLLAFIPAQAAESAKPGTAPAKSAAAKPAKATAQRSAQARTPLLTRDELRDCISTEARLKQQREETLQLQAQLAADKQALMQSGDELKQQFAALDRTNEELVQQHVDKHNAREKRIAVFQANAAEFNTRAEALNAAQQAYAKACENRRFDEKDEIAIRQGK
jgi:hypothetical protein